MDATVEFTYQTDFQLVDEQRYANWLTQCSKAHNATSLTLVYAFMDDNSLLELNTKYLNHNTLTDIITFDDSLGYDINANIAISIERVRANAISLAVPEQEELLRVMAHGLLHCVGFKDKSPDEELIMRNAEDSCIQMSHVKQNNEPYVS